MATNNNDKTLNVPPLRFPEFSGEWEEEQLDSIATLSKGIGISKEQLSEDGEPCILYGELYTKYKSEIIKQVESKTDIDCSKLKRSKANDVIIPCSGETAVDIATARCVPFDNILLGGDLNIISLHKYDGAFMSYQLNGKRKYDIARVAQGVSVVHLYGEHLKAIKTYNPSLPEQQKIAKLLSLIDERIATQNKIIEDLKKLKSAIRKKIFSLLKDEYTKSFEINQLLDYEQPTAYIVANDEYSTDTRLTPVLTANKGFIFGYTDEKIVLHDVKLYADPGQKLAFVGSTGAGKTTITNLINRFYDIQDGKIRYDGININKIKKADLRRSLGIVLQDTHLFTGTVMDNIRYGNLEATDEEVIAAAKLANADSFIRRLPDGYHTMLTGDGGNLSQGQRQLLAIARAAVANPPALILDEATSSIDTRTERIVQEGMDALMKGRTTFVIAHRLSTIKNSDCIMVLEQGRIIERGNHDQLMEEKGTYYKLQTGSNE